MTRDITGKEYLLANDLAINPLDGRYAKIGEKFSGYFSEYGLAKYRTMVEVLWLVFLLEHVNGSAILDEHDNVADTAKIRSIYETFDGSSYKAIKEYEAVVRHDVKAVVLFIADKLKKMGYGKLTSYVHLGCTSEDINNCAYALILKDSVENVWLKAAKKLQSMLSVLSITNANIPMLAYVHGQPVAPTTVGKELAVFAIRMKKSIENICLINPCAKFNGTAGNYAAVRVAFPKENWPILSKRFVEDYLNLEFNPVTTQIENHDYISHLMDGIRHFNNVLRDFDQDMWLYLSKNYFKQAQAKGKENDSIIPRRANTTRFENSEGNIMMSNSICVVLSDELPKSRLQRDLSDSSLQRNIGIAFCYSLRAVEQAISGMKRVVVNEEQIAEDLKDSWQVLIEPIKTMLNKYGIPEAINQLRELALEREITKKDIHTFIKSLDVLSTEDKKTLLNLTPSKYIGYAAQLVIA